MRDCESVYRVGAGIMSGIVLWDTTSNFNVLF